MEKKVILKIIFTVAFSVIYSFPNNIYSFTTLTLQLFAVKKPPIQKKSLPRAEQSPKLIMLLLSASVAENKH